MLHVGLPEEALQGPQRQQPWRRERLGELVGLSRCSKGKGERHLEREKEWVKPGGPIKEHVQPPHQKTIHICSPCPCSYLTANRSVRSEDPSEPERDGTGSPKLFARPQNQRGGRFVDRRLKSCRTFTDDKDSTHAMSVPMHDQMGFSCRLWEELGSSVSALVVLTIQPRHSQHQRPRALLSGPRTRTSTWRITCTVRIGEQDLHRSFHLPGSPFPPAPCYSLPYIIFHVRAHKCCCGSPA